MREIIQWKQAVAGLRKAADANTQLSLLTQCCDMPLSNPAQLKIYHDTLLFLVAYPFNRKVFELAEKELHRIAETINLKQSNLLWQRVLYGSGLPYTELQCQYSAGITAWILAKFGELAEPVAGSNSNEATKMLWQAMLPGIEFYESTQGNNSTWGRVKKLSGYKQDNKALLWIIQLFKQQQWNPALKELLFNELGLFVKWTLKDTSFSRSFLRWPIQTVQYNKAAKNKIDSSSIVKEPLLKPLLLKEEEKTSLIDLCKSSLALYYRETDPVTFADPAETSLYDMGNGLQIALTGMQKNWRLAIESYIGFMAFKNGVPVAYGGGWLFGHRCKIGVNIYPPFRGAESGRIFCQVMRLYYQVFHARHFIVKPYQFGKGNPEGIKSGAFWFYYKLGFRPQNDEIKKTACDEWEKIKDDRKYRTPINVLKYFTSSNMHFEPVKSGTNNFDADKTSKAVTSMICSRFSGDRKTASDVCLKELVTFLGIKKLSQAEADKQNIWHNWALLFTALPDTVQWDKMQRKKFLQLIQLKISGSEKDYITAMQNHSRFWHSAKELCKNADANK